MLAVNKPVGLVVHPAPGNWNGTLVNALAFYLQAQERAQGGQGVNKIVVGDKALAGTHDELRPGIVHRLDKGTSGEPSLLNVDDLSKERLLLVFLLGIPTVVFFFASEV